MLYGHENSTSSSVRRMNPAIVSTSRPDATSPAECPPMPSATTNSRSSGSLMKRSWFDFRTGPGSLRPWASTKSGPRRMKASESIGRRRTRQYYYGSTKRPLLQWWQEDGRPLQPPLVRRREGRQRIVERESKKPGVLPDDGGRDDREHVLVGLRRNVARVLCQQLPEVAIFRVLGHLFQPLDHSAFAPVVRGHDQEP